MCSYTHIHTSTHIHKHTNAHYLQTHTLASSNTSSLPTHLDTISIFFLKARVDAALRDCDEVAVHDGR